MVAESTAVALRTDRFLRNEPGGGEHRRSVARRPKQTNTAKASGTPILNSDKSASGDCAMMRGNSPGPSRRRIDF